MQIRGVVSTRVLVDLSSKVSMRSIAIAMLANGSVAALAIQVGIVWLSLSRASFALASRTKTLDGSRMLLPVLRRFGEC